MKASLTLTEAEIRRAVFDHVENTTSVLSELSPSDVVVRLSAQEDTGEIIAIIEFEQEIAE